MSVTRDNHFVPQWYQSRFFADGRKSLKYLDLHPPVYKRKDGAISTGKALFDAPTKRAFFQTDLYSTFFGTHVDDEIERKLFGDIDRRGAVAVPAFCADDINEWHGQFETLFEFLDIQKLRTPKGLDWLRGQYPELSQNDLMQEMQSIRFMNCTIWMQGIREIVSAQDAATKFIITDHPVTIYNHAIPPDDPKCDHPHDPAIALKGSQTLFPLGPDHCLILTNLEYAREPAGDPLSKRTFARNFQHGMVNAIEFIKSRRLTSHQVCEINAILKSRAVRHIAAGREEWLYPEQVVGSNWAGFKSTLMPPDGEFYRFGGELMAGFDDGHVHFQDEFGRSEKPRDFLHKPKLSAAPKSRHACPCGSGRAFRHCCEPKPERLRPSWTELSIRERNMALFRGICHILELDRMDWADARAAMTDAKIADVYGLYSGLWPLETDLLSLLPKPDGTLRGVYTGHIDPDLITEFASALPMYFGEMLIQHPFPNAATMQKEFRPTENPGKFRGDVLMSVMTFLRLVPFVEVGLINLIPDPMDFDFHLRDRILAMAESRVGGIEVDPMEDLRYRDVFERDRRRDQLAAPDPVLVRRLNEAGMSVTDGTEIATVLDRIRRDDIYSVLQPGWLDGTAQLRMMKMAPNFELSMYLAQAVGGHIVTDSPFRWRELRAALNRRFIGTSPALPGLTKTLSAVPFTFPLGHDAILELHDTQPFASARAAMKATTQYLAALGPGREKPNFEAQLAARLASARSEAGKLVNKSGRDFTTGKVTGVFRTGGFQDNSINRLLLMSSSESHLQHVPMAFKIERV